MLVAAWLGAALFFASLTYFAYFYLVVLAQPGVAAPGQSPWSIAINITLFTAFALHHSVFARTGIKAALTRVLPPAFERSAYVWMASLLFLGLCILWQPVPGTAWQAAGPLRALLYGIQVAGMAVTLQSASRLDIWDLSGVRQARARPQPSGGNAHDGPAAATTPTTPVSPAPLEVSGPYRWLRHPIYLGWVLLVFGAPTMTAGRLLFVAISTVYLVVAIPIEERALVQEFGQSYRDYQKQVRWRLVPGVW